MSEKVSAIYDNLLIINCNQYLVLFGYKQFLTYVMFLIFYLNSQIINPSTYYFLKKDEHYEI